MASVSGDEIDGHEVGCRGRPNRPATASRQGDQLGHGRHWHVPRPRLEARVTVIRSPRVLEWALSSSGALIGPASASRFQGFCDERGDKRPPQSGARCFRRPRSRCARWIKIVVFPPPTDDPVIRICY